MPKAKQTSKTKQTSRGRTSTGKARSKKRYSKSIRGVIIALVSLMSVVAILCIGGGVYVMNLLGKIGTGVDTPTSYDTSYDPGDIESIPDYVFESDPYENAASVSDIPVMGDTKDITNIMLIGIDGRNNYSARSDSNMILSINKKKKTIKLISLLRDTCVTIPGRDTNHDGKDDYNKLNAAYAFGKEELLFRTVEQNFRLKIDKFVAVNFTAFPIVVDKLGGVDIELTANEAGQVPAPGTKITAETYDPNFQPLSDKGGSFHLDGFQTLQYARIRHIDSDFGRVQRQQKVVKILLDKARKSNIFTLMGMLDDLFPQVKTNMTNSELLGYVMDVGSYMNYEVQTTYHIPQDGAYRNETINGGAMLVLKDPKQSVTELHAYIYG